MKALVFLFIFFGLFNHPVYCQNQCDVCEKLKNNVVKITATFDDGKEENGFGTVIAERDNKLYIVTAKHVIYNLDERGLVSNDNKTKSAVIKFSSDLGKDYSATLLNLPASVLDISLLEVEKPKNYTWTKEFYSNTIETGTKVWFIGRSGKWYVPTGSFVGSVNNISADDEIIIDINSVQPGTSGAPLISSDGIVGLIFEDAADGAKAYPIAKIIKLITKTWNYPWEMNLSPTDNQSDNIKTIADDSVQNTGLDTAFESPPAYIVKGMLIENNPELSIASIKIRNRIEWSETVFTKEEKNKIIRMLTQNNRTEEDYISYKIYDAQYLKHCDQIFELGRYKEYIDPCFDITLLNKGQAPQILSRIGIEIEEAYFTVMSLGDIESKKVKVRGRYEVEFPSPEKIDIYGDIIDLKKNNLKIANYEGFMRLSGRDIDDTRPIKTITGKLIDAETFLDSYYQTTNFSYADLPKTVMIDLNDPIQIDQNQAFRFLLRITNSQYIPTHTTIKFVLKTDKGIKLSKPIYLLKP